MFKKNMQCTSGSVVEYRLAKARVAGSNPVSCSQWYKKGDIRWIPPFLYVQALPGSNGSKSWLRCGRRRRTSGVLFFIGYAMHSSGKNSLAAGRYFHYFAWLVAFTNFSQKISTQLLTWLIISVILQTEQRKKKRNQKGYKKSQRFPEIF